MVRRRIAYAVALVVALIAFLGTNNPLALAVLLLLAILLAASAVAGMVLAATTDLACNVPASCEVGQPLALAIEVRRGVRLPAGRIECRVRCRNLMRGSEQVTPVILDAADGRTARFELPLDTSACGRIELSVEEVRQCDPLGLLRRAGRGSFSGSYTVYPRVLDLTVPMERSPRAAFSGVTYDPRRRGQDRSEPFDIRDYRATDPPHAIHWKLSSKFDRLLVREASHPSNYDILLLVDAGLSRPGGAPVPDAAITALLDLAASVSFALYRQNMGHNVAFASEGRLADAMVDSAASFEGMLDVLVGTPLPAVLGVDGGLFDWYRREHSFTKTVLVTASVDLRACSEMGAVTDLSVLLVTEAGAKAVEETGPFALTSIPAEDIGSVKSVVI